MLYLAPKGSKGAKKSQKKLTFSGGILFFFEKNISNPRITLFISWSHWSHWSHLLI